MLRKRAADDTAPMSVIGATRSARAYRRGSRLAGEGAGVRPAGLRGGLQRQRSDARGHAETAVRLAEAVGTSAALVWAYGARAHTFWGTDEGIADAERAFALAAVSNDPQLVRWSGLFLSNSYESAGRYADAAAITGNAYRALRDEGEFDYAATMGAMAARWNFVLGRWAQARGLVRELLTIARSQQRRRDLTLRRIAVELPTRATEPPR